MYQGKFGNDEKMGILKPSKKRIQPKAGSLQPFFVENFANLWFLRKIAKPLYSHFLLLLLNYINN